MRYRATLQYVDPDGVAHSHPGEAITIEADSPAEAESQAIAEGFDERLRSSGCTPLVALEALDNAQ